MTLEEIGAATPAQTFEYVLVTPEMAVTWLANPHPRQRRSGRVKVRKYTDLMARGQWDGEVPQPVCFTAPDEGGQLINGGHRLSAVAQSGVPTVLLIARNVPARVFDVIDTGLIRAAKQFVDGSDGDAQQRAARWLMWYEERFATKPTRPALSFELRAIVLKAANQARFRVGLSTKKRLHPKSTLAADIAVVRELVDHGATIPAAMAASGR